MPQTSETPTPPRAIGPLEGQVAVVSGAGQGIGAAFAQHLSSLGASVVVLDLIAENAQRVSESLSGPSIALTADVANESEVAEARDRTLEKFGGVDILVNCAAIFSSIQMKSFNQISTSEWDSVMAVNVRGTFLSCREFGAPMTENGYGRIVNMSSGTVHMGRPNYLHYVTSKAAVIGLTRALARELGEHGITVNAIAPGSTETEVKRGAMTDSDANAIVAKQAIARRQRPEDIYSVLTFLTHPDSDFITGQTIIVDGGVAFS